MIIETNKVPSLETIKKDLKLEHHTCLLIYDRKLKRFSQNYHLKFPVQGGEKLKSLESFSQKTKTLFQKLSLHSSPYALLALGGGSVGDFSGFLASVLHRGVPLVLLPSTWLSALDSSHGGKTALNIGSFKNQLGSFYPAQCVYLVKEILESQPKIRKKEALGELAKMIFLNKELFLKFQNQKTSLFPSLLSCAIKVKLDVVKKDPFEKKGLRKVFNLGHTLGHVLELHYRISHGESVACGLYFSLSYSLHEKLLNVKEYEKMIFILKTMGLEKKYFKRKISRRKFINYISCDKKAISKTIDFIFLKGIGKPFKKRVTFEDLFLEAKRQGFVI